MKRIISSSCVLILVLGLALIGTSVYPRIKHAEYYNLDTFKGIEVYVWQSDDGEYRCGAMSGTNRNKTIEELISLAESSATIDEMKTILSSYDIDIENVIIILVENPLTNKNFVIEEINPEAIYDLFW